MKENNLLFAIVILAVGFVIINPGLTGQYHADPLLGLSSQPATSDRFAVGNADHDPDGFIDVFDLDALENIIQLRKYDQSADMDHDGDVDWEDYGLLENFIVAEGSGSVGGREDIGGRGGICTIGETKCARNIQSGTGSIQVCKPNRYGAPQFYRESCPTGSRCRNGVCEFRQAVRLH